jgi:hypothetical protein
MKRKRRLRPGFFDAFVTSKPPDGAAVGSGIAIEHKGFCDVLRGSNAAPEQRAAKTASLLEARPIRRERILRCGKRASAV